MKKSNYFLIIIAILITMIYLFFPSNKQNNYTIIEKTIQWYSMYPLLKDAQKVFLVVDYFKDNAPEVWDIVAFNYGGSNHLYIKMIKATYDNKLEIIWENLYIDGALMKNSVWAVYSFSPGEIKMLSLYIKDGYIPKWSYFIFWDNISDSIDSRRFWAVSKDDIFWKFLIK